MIESNAPSPKRADLHCHSEASNKAAEVLLTAIRCPECYSTPDEVHAQAKRRGMDFVTLTDHDTMLGALALAGRTDVLTGEEVTCWFPEDECKLHLLVWGITPEDHAQLQALARNVYDVAAYVEMRNLAHAVAHPIYRQNDKLERWHLERLLLQFKGFECLNGAHSALHREAFEPLLDAMSRNGLLKLAEKHDLPPRWHEPWIKARVGGSDDHGLLNIGTTWTEFPPDTQSVEDVLQCLRDGTCKPGGESGSSAKLAHTFYSIAVRYYSRQILPGDAQLNLPGQLMQALVGERALPSKAQLVRKHLAGKLRALRAKVLHPLGKRTDNVKASGVLAPLFLESLKQRIGDFPLLREALTNGLPPLGEHEEMTRLVSAINRDVSAGIADAISRSIDEGSFRGLFDGIAAALAQQFVLLPYYFAVFHQNRERHLLRDITGQASPRDARTLKVGLFTDTFDEVNGVGRFLRDIGRQAGREECSLIIHTCTTTPRFESPVRKNFAPLLSRPLPYYPDLQLNLPPLLDVLAWADKQQFDVIHVSTPGPMGLCGWAAAKMLRVPLVGTYHTDFPAYMEQLTHDHRAVNATSAYMRWFYGQLASVLTRSRVYVHNLRELGVTEDRLRALPPSVDGETFNPRHGDEALWKSLGVTHPHRLLYCGRVSVEKNLPLLAESFKLLCARRRDTALVIAGDGPYLTTMRESLADLPAYFLGCQVDSQLAPLYASSDLLVFPSRTDTLGQVVMEAQASGLPALVSNEGGPSEIVQDQVTGLVISAKTPAAWAQAIDELLDDEPLRERMGRVAPQRMGRFSLKNTFDAFWATHVNAAHPPAADDAPAAPVDLPRLRV